MPNGFINNNEIGAIPSVEFTEIDGATYLAPGTPGSGQLQLYPKTDNSFYTKNSAGVESPLVTGSGFTPLSRAPVVAAAIVDTTIAGPGATIDGFALTNGDRVLLTAQGTGSQNGLWVFNGAAVAMTRPTDYVAGSTFWATAGVQVLVLNGTANKWTTWRLTTTGAITIDTTSTSWSPIGGLQVRGTTEQLRLGYDSTNYVSFTTSSGGNLTLAPTGTVVTISTTGAITLPSGTTAQEPAGVAGMLRWNTTTSRHEFYNGSAWINHVRLPGDTMTGTLEVDVATATSNALILKSTDDTATKNLFEGQNSSGVMQARISNDGRLGLVGTTDATAFITANASKSIAGSGSQIGALFKFGPTLTITTANQTAVVASMTSAMTVNQNGFNVTATPGGVRGQYVNATASGATGTVTHAAGGLYQTINSGAGTLTTGVAVYVIAAANSGGGTFANAIGVMIENHTVGSTSNANLVIGTAPASGNYSIYSASTNASYFAGSTQFEAAGITTTSTDRLILSNSTAATAGVTVQYSPRLRWSGHVWDTGLGGADKTHNLEMHLEPISANPSSFNFRVMADTGAGTYSTIATLSSAGTWTVTGNITGSVITAQRGSLAATSSDGFVTTNTVAATAGVPVQMSPRQRLTAHVWDTGAGGSDKTVNWITEVFPTSASPTTSILRFGVDQGVGSYTYVFSINDAGTLTLADAANIVIGTGTGTKIGTATNEKIGFWNAGPIVQPTTAIAAATFAANTSGIANDTATWDGFTIGQIVKALRNIGLLA